MFTVRGPHGLCLGFFYLAMLQSTTVKFQKLKVNILPAGAKGHSNKPNLYIRDVPETEYLIWKGTDNGFKRNNEFYQIIAKIIGRHSHSSFFVDNS